MRCKFTSLHCANEGERVRSNVLFPRWPHTLIYAFVCYSAMWIVGAIPGRCASIKASMYFLRSLIHSRLDKEAANCGTPPHCEDIKPGVMKLTCPKGYEINTNTTDYYCHICQGKSSLTDLLCQKLNETNSDVMMFLLAKYCQWRCHQARINLIHGQ